MPAVEQLSQPVCKSMQTMCSSLPELAEDAHVHSSGSRHFKAFKPIGIGAMRLHQTAQHSMQPAAAIMAFRPDLSLTSTYQEPSAGYVHTADAVRDRWPSQAEAKAFSAAIRQRAQSDSHGQQPFSAERPFPGMHTLDLDTHLARPAIHEAVQNLMEDSQGFLRLATCCSMSQVIESGMLIATRLRQFGCAMVPYFCSESYNPKTALRKICCIAVQCLVCFCIDPALSYILWCRK